MHTCIDLNADGTISAASDDDGGRLEEEDGGIDIVGGELSAIRRGNWVAAGKVLALLAVVVDEVLGRHNGSAQTLLVCGDEGLGDGRPGAVVVTWRPLGRASRTACVDIRLLVAQRANVRALAVVCCFVAGGQGKTMSQGGNEVGQQLNRAQIVVNRRTIPCDDLTRVSDAYFGRHEIATYLDELRCKLEERLPPVGPERLTLEVPVLVPGVSSVVREELSDYQIA